MNTILSHLVAFVEALRTEAHFVKYDVDYPVDLHPMVVTPITIYLLQYPDLTTTLLDKVKADSDIFYLRGKQWAASCTYHRELIAQTSDVELWEVAFSLLHFVFIAKRKHQAFLHNTASFDEYVKSILFLK